MADRQHNLRQLAVTNLDIAPGYPYYDAKTWIDRLFSRFPGSRKTWPTVDSRMVQDPMKSLLDAYGPVVVPLLQLLSDEELARNSPGGPGGRTIPKPPSLVDFFDTPVYTPPAG